MKIQISVSANIVNHSEIKQYLEELIPFSESPATLKWINSNLKNYMTKLDVLKDKKTGLELQVYAKAKKDDPEWLRTGLKEGKEFHEAVITPSFKRNIEHALGYINTVADPVRISVPDAIDLGNKKISEENAKAGSGEDPTKLQILHTYSNGYKWVALTTAKQLQREGKLMNHCVGNLGQPYIKDVAARKIQIWSLRDKSNIPYCTIEYNIKEKRVKQIKGPYDRGVDSKMVPYCHKFLQALVKKKVIKDFDPTDLSLIGVLDQDKTWYNLYALPEDFTVKGSLDLRHQTIDFLPKNLSVKGSLYLPNVSEDSRFILTYLPEGLVVSGDLYLANTPLNSLPSGLLVGRDLDLRNTEIESLPENMVIGTLRLNNLIKEIPKTLRVLNTLYLGNPGVVIPEGTRIAKIEGKY